MKNILSSTAKPHRYANDRQSISYWVKTRAGLDYLSYAISGGRCKLAHLDARWFNHAIPLVFALPGGNLRDVTLRARADGTDVIVVDRWHRRFEEYVHGPFQEGLTLWGDAGPLHVAIGGAWRGQAGSDVFVGKEGPRLYPSGESDAHPSQEWDVDRHAWVDSPSVYNP